MLSRKINSYVVIPARYASTRLPQKMLLAETGKPLVQYAYEAAKRAEYPVGVTIAADHPAIFEAVRNFGGEVVMTDPNAASGTDRIAEVAQSLPDIDIFVNVQGDEPEMSPVSIDMLIELLADNPDVPMATLCTPIRDKNQLENPACVKVVRDRNGRALYFSRSVIPHPRNWTEEMLNCEPPLFYLHLGLYAYRRDFLLQMPHLPQCPLETAESLEQLRVLYNGDPILCGVTPHSSVGIDTREDYDAFVSRTGKKEK
ncbi:MAG: 3-deoxy-manno-octulosonate cytidylyltransferase [Planctomycetaceae bacterium]|jgi:3-deoxy-manno-octulosonate cytidylyltransferase (CMP-KDO synthetase)|nr:3-deoxy-manno-octulosonate cytidylyltransferase [Planctomycetaceae bacterium]